MAVSLDATLRPRPLGKGAFAFCGLYALGTAILLSISPYVALVPVVLAVLLIPLVRRPRIAPAVVLLLVPLVSGMPRGSIVPIFKPNELVLIFVFVAYALALLLGKKQKIETTFLDKAFLIFVMARSVLPLIAHPVSVAADPATLAKFFLAPFQYYLLYRLILGTARTREDLTLLLRVMIAGAVVVAVVGLLQAMRVPEIEHLLRTYYPSGKLIYTFEHSRRVTSLFGGGWNVCGFYLSQALLLTIALHPFERPGLSRAVLVVTGMLLALVMGLSFSFTTTITLVVALAYFGYRKGKLGTYLLRAAPVAVLLFVFALTLFGGALQERLSLQFRGTFLPATLLARLYFWKEMVLPAIGGKLIWGIGPSRFAWTTAESEYVFFVVNCGLVGLAGFLVFIGFVWKKLRALSRRINPATLEGTLVVLGLTLFLQNLIASTTGHYFEYSGASETLWAVWAMAAVGVKLRDGSTGTSVP